jgi:hypothetical protein
VTNQKNEKGIIEEGGRMNVAFGGTVDGTKRTLDGIVNMPHI